MIGAVDAWRTTTGNGAKIMVLDTGHDQGHDDLPSVPTANCDLGFGGCADGDGHGTHVLGDFVARNNLDGSVGVAPGVAGSDTYVWRVSTGGSWDEDSVFVALDSAMAWDVDVVNMSFSSFDYNPAFALKISSVFGDDIVLVASAGNDTTATVKYPAGYSGVLGVSGVRTDMSFATTSPCGGNSNYGSHVDLAAPSNQYEDEDDGWCGTSFSSPHVAGVAALIRAESPAMANYTVYDRLSETAEDLGSGGWDAYFGDGLVDASAALGPYADIEGPTSVKPNQECTWMAERSGGLSPFSYTWYLDGDSVASGIYYDGEVGTSSFELWVTIRDTHGFNDSKVLQISVSQGGEDCEAKD